MVKDWHTITSREVGSDHKIPVPEDVRQAIELKAGRMVWWSYEKHTRYTIVSNNTLDRENYESVDFRRVYGPKGNETIRPPVETSEENPDFPEDILSYFHEGREMYYLIYRDMITDGGRKSAFLLSKSQVLELLPEGKQEAESDLEESILNTPGFLPTPR